MFGLRILGNHHKFHYFKPNSNILLSVRILQQVGMGSCGNRTTLVNTVSPEDSTGTVQSVPEGSAVSDSNN